MCGEQGVMERVEFMPVLHLRYAGRERRHVRRWRCTTYHRYGVVEVQKGEKSSSLTTTVIMLWCLSDRKSTRFQGVLGGCEMEGWGSMCCWK